MESVMFMYSWEGRVFGILWISLENDAGVRLIVEGIWTSASRWCPDPGTW